MSKSTTRPAVLQPEERFELLALLGFEGYLAGLDRLSLLTPGGCSDDAPVVTALSLEPNHRSEHRYYYDEHQSKSTGEPLQPLRLGGPIPEVLLDLRQDAGLTLEGVRHDAVEPGSLGPSFG
jgi:hypothetical protein